MLHFLTTIIYFTRRRRHELLIRTGLFTADSLPLQGSRSIWLLPCLQFYCRNQYNLRGWEPFKLASKLLSLTGLPAIPPWCVLRSSIARQGTNTLAYCADAAMTTPQKSLSPLVTRRCRNEWLSRASLWRSAGTGSWPAAVPAMVRHHPLGRPLHFRRGRILGPMLYNIFCP